MELSYLIWTGSPEIFTVTLPVIDKELTLRWYGLFFALGFLISQQILYFIFKKEGKPEKDVDTITMYMVIATIIGARLGHVLFYEPARYLSNPIDILKIWEGGLASHGAAIAILFALWLYSRKKKEGQGYFQIVDRIVILVALTGALIRLGNYFNSEIIGKPTHSKSGIVFARYPKEIIKSNPIVEDVRFAQVDSAADQEGRPPINILIDFKRSAGMPHDELLQRFKAGPYSDLLYNAYIREHLIVEPSSKFKFGQDEDGKFYAIVNAYGIPRYPSQLFESISCLLLFLLLYWLWTKQKANLPPGRLLGIFLIYCFGLRFLYEFTKEPQVAFEESMTLNMGQWLSIPLVAAGIVILILSYRKKEISSTNKLT